MGRKIFRIVFICSFFIINASYASSIVFHKRNAVVWSPNQVITGELAGFTAEEVTVHHDQDFFSVIPGLGHEFSFELVLQKDTNKIWIEAQGGEEAIVSDTLFLILGYKPTPILKPVATLDGNNVILSSEIIENPFDTPIKYVWAADAQNPAETEINDNEESIATVAIPDIPGKYYYNLLTVAGEDSAWFQTLVIKGDETLRAFNIDTDHPTWMNDAVIYEITPYNFVSDGKFNDITAKLPELEQLGINTIWLQPVFRSSYKGQGYDVVDYLSINPALGTEQELQQLIMKAKELGMRVLFDLVLNHTSIKHPYAQGRIAHGENSHYFNFYQSENDGKPYSEHYNKDENGFMYYFWSDLVNLNYHNEEVQRWMLEVCKHWVKKYDIDGYRFDAIWGVNARMPSFAGRLRTELKSIKPEALLLAEDKGSDPEVYALGYDAAFDWAPGRSWVSQWSWEHEYSETESKTIFNHPDVDQRGELLRQALFQNEAIGYRKLRFLENNDLHRFIESHQLERTKMAAALIFAAPGIPMLYNGQEIGFGQHPYVTNAVFYRNTSIRSLDQHGLFDHYRKLSMLKQQYSALRDTTIKEIPVAPAGSLVAFQRWNENENFVIVINMNNAATHAKINLSDILPEESAEEYWLHDVLTDRIFNINMENSEADIPMNEFSMRWLLLKDEGTITSTIENGNNQNVLVYPNPSNGKIGIKFSGLSSDYVRVFDMLGNIVFEKNISRTKTAMQIEVNLPPNMYIIQIGNGKEVQTKKILINDN